MDDHAKALTDAVERSIGPWVVAAVQRRADPDGLWDDHLRASAEHAADLATVAVMDSLRSLLAADIDAQTTTPLSVLRKAVPFATEILRSAGVAPVPRDPDQQSRFPDDSYDLVPASFFDLGDDVGQAGIAWGAAKAFVHRQRHGGAQ